MEVSPMITLSSLPTCGALLGTTGNRDILDMMNERDAGSGIVFGSDNDPYADEFRQFNTQFVDAARRTMFELEEASAVVSAPTEYIEIKSEDDFANVTPSMYLPLLTHAPIRKLFKEHKIAGWGVDEKLVPDNDPYKNPLHWGLVESLPEGGFPEYVDWTWCSEDAHIEWEHLDKVRESRRFLADYVAEQLKGDLNDPTDFDNGGMIGDII